MPRKFVPLGASKRVTAHTESKCVYCQTEKSKHCVNATERVLSPHEASYPDFFEIQRHLVQNVKTQLSSKYVKNKIIFCLRNNLTYLIKLKLNNLA